MTARREFKSNIFGELFSTPEAFITLYNALSGSNLPTDTPAKRVTLDGILSGAERNDASFLLQHKLVFFAEQQSTINPNMPFRFLLFLGQSYQEVLSRRNRYTSTLQKIPRPEFIVLYNGDKPLPDRQTLKLSDAFEDLPENVISLGNIMELTVDVININEGRNEDMVAKSPELSDYVKFIAVVKRKRKKDKDKDLRRAIEAAVEYCICNDILKDFLLKHREEVVNVLYGQYDAELARQVLIEETVDGERKKHEVVLRKQQEERMQSARNFLSMGISAEQIALAMSLTPGEIAEMLKSQG